MMQRLGGTCRRATARPGRLVRGLAATAALVACVLSAAGPAPAGGGVADWLQAGWQAYQAGGLAAAQDAFAHAASLAPQSATPAVWLGAVLVARGDRAGARRWFAAALERHPSAAQAGYVEAWLERLGIEVARPRWHVGTPAELARFVKASNPSLTDPQALWLGTAIRAAASRERIDERLLASVLFIESRFEHRSISPAGAEGLGQLMPGTAAGLGVDPRDPWENLLGSARLLRADYEEFRSVPLALAAYNAGSGAVRRWGGIPPYAETQWYVWAVQWVYRSLAG